MSSRRSLQTILFTDIVASTNRATELGDRGWSELLQEHHHRVRREIQRFGGREIKALGDGFLAAFPRPSQAIRCAWAIRESTRELGLEVRGGIHVGEVEQQGSDLSGIAVHICSRIAAAAAPGEILVSNAVREMETGSGFRFQDRGKHELRGVSGEWRLFALESLPAGTTFRTGRWIPELSSRQARIAVASVLGLLLITMILWAVQNRTQFDGNSDSATIPSAAPGIAVLPFTVQGEGLDVMREGIVSLLSTGLDGRGGLRTIAPGTLFARWREHVSDEETPELPTALEIARQSGARYALIGSMVSIGSRMRVVADVYEVRTGDRLGQAQVEGSPEDMLPVVDRLGVEVLRVILQGQEELPEIDLARLTTESPEALKAYLEGEVHFRHFDLEAAQQAYTRAVAADSMFALAHYRLANAYGWGQASNPTLLRLHQDRASQLLDRLPTREALLVRSKQARDHGLNDQVEALREAVRLHPDDAEIWYELAETYTHVHSAWATAEEVEQTFGRAVELDPLNAVYLIHYVEFPWFFPDSARASERLAMLERVAPNTSRARGGQLALALAFGDSITKEAARRRLDAENVEVLSDAAVFLFHPRNRVQLDVAREIYERGDEGQRIAWGLFDLYHRNTWWWGKVREGMAYLEDPEFPDLPRTTFIYNHFAFGLPMEEDMLQVALDPARIDSVSHGQVIFAAGAFAADRSRWSDHEHAQVELERRAKRAFAEADTSNGMRIAGMATALEGYGLWKRGQPEAALLMFEDEQALRQFDVLWWLTLLYSDLGRFRDAERVYRSYRYLPDFNLTPLAHRELGKVYASLGEYDKAREAYEYFIKYWDDADPELQPMVEEARQAVIRLRGVRRE